MIGTPSYMAPEQVMGQSLDGRADLYALALVLYEALAGRLPFDAAPGLAMALARLHGEPLPLAQGCAATLPAGLAAVVEAAMASDPAQRPADAAAMGALLQQVLAARPA
jgi:serine/threonine-protein kinase